jgi:hypothetical protein
MLGYAPGVQKHNDWISGEETMDLGIRPTAVEVKTMLGR